jgi:hypothetical protein
MVNSQQQQLDPGQPGFTGAFSQAPLAGGTGAPAGGINPQLGGGAQTIRLDTPQDIAASSAAGAAAEAAGLQRGTPEWDAFVNQQKAGGAATGRSVTAAGGGGAFTPTTQQSATGTARDVPLTGEQVPPPSGIPQQLFDPELDARLRGQVFNPGEQQQFDPRIGKPITGPEAQQQGQFDASGAPIQDQLTQTLQESLANPSGFTSDVATDTFKQLRDELNQGFQSQRANIDTDAARRGVFFSTAPLAGKSRLASDQARQQRGLAQSILTEQGRTLGADRARAIGQAQTEAGRGFGEQLQSVLAQQGAGQQRFGQELAAGQFGQGQKGQDFGQQLQQFLANQGATQQQQNISSQQLRDLQQQRGQATESQLAANQQQIQQEQFQDKLGLQAGQLGLQGGPDQNQLLTNIASLFGGQQGGQVDPAIFNLIAQMFGGQ